MCRMVIIDGALNEETLQRATTTKSGRKKKDATSVAQSENDNLFVVVRRSNNENATYRNETEFELGKAYANRQMRRVCLGAIFLIFLVVSRGKEGE